MNVKIIPGLLCERTAASSFVARTLSNHNAGAMEDIPLTVISMNLMGVADVRMILSTIRLLFLSVSKPKKFHSSRHFIEVFHSVRLCCSVSGENIYRSRTPTARLEATLSNDPMKRPYQIVGSIFI